MLGREGDSGQLFGIQAGEEIRHAAIIASRPKALNRQGIMLLRNIA